MPIFHDCEGHKSYREEPTTLSQLEHCRHTSFRLQSLSKKRLSTNFLTNRWTSQLHLLKKEKKALFKSYLSKDKKGKKNQNSQTSRIKRLSYLNTYIMTNNKILRTGTLKSTIKKIMSDFSFLKDCQEKYFIKYTGN